MSVIAGIVCLRSGDVVTEHQLQPMLESMRPYAPCETEHRIVLGGKAAIGRVIYGPYPTNKKHKLPADNVPEVFCVGELYNDDTAMQESADGYILKRYLDRGIDGFALGLNGSFAAVICDPRDCSVMLVTDHTNSRALFMMIHNNRVYFASEVKAFFHVDGFQCQLDTSSVLSLAVREFFVRRKTLVKGLDQIDYATVCRIANGTVEARPYWRYNVEPSEKRSTRSYIEEFSWLLKRAVARRTRQGKVAVMLSGGIDSRGILCCLSDPHSICAVTYTPKTRSTRHNCGEWAVAESITRKLNIDLSIVRCEPSALERTLHKSVYIADAAAGFVREDIWDKVKDISGCDFFMFGDECMGWSGGPMRPARVFRSVGLCTLGEILSFSRYFRPELLNSFIQLSSEDISVLRTGLAVRNACDQVDELYFDQRLIHFLMPKRTVILNHGLGVRNPWLDFEVLDFVRSLPTHHRVGKSLFRKTLHHMCPHLAAQERARVAELVDYQPCIVSIEKQSRSISGMLRGENSLFGEFFDVSRCLELVERICVGQTKTHDSVKHVLSGLMPISFRVKLKAYRDAICNPKRQLSGVDLLLRLLLVSTALRYFTQGFKKRP